MSEREISSTQETPSAYRAHAVGLSARVLDDFECPVDRNSSNVLLRLWPKNSTQSLDFIATPGDALLLAEALIRASRAALKNLL